MNRLKSIMASERCELGFWVGFMAVCLILAAVTFSMGGCGATTRIDPPKTDVSVTTTEYTPDGRAHTVTTENVKTQGPGGTSSGDNAHVNAEGEAPTAHTKSITTGGGKMKADGDASILKSAAAQWIVGIVGFLLMCAGGAGLYLRQPVKAAGGTAAIGVGLIVCAVFPSIALYILLALALYAAGSLWLTGFDAAKFRESLRATRAGIADLKATYPDAHEALTSEDPETGLIVAHAEGSDMKTMKKIDLKDGLKN